MERWLLHLSINTAFISWLCHDGNNPQHKHYDVSSTSGCDKNNTMSPGYFCRHHHSPVPPLPVRTLVTLRDCWISFIFFLCHTQTSFTSTSSSRPPSILSFLPSLPFPTVPSLLFPSDKFYHAYFYSYLILIPFLPLLTFHFVLAHKVPLFYRAHMTPVGLIQGHFIDLRPFVVRVNFILRGCRDMQLVPDPSYRILLCLNWSCWSKRRS